jgi:hypothetical protein
MVLVAMRQVATATVATDSLAVGSGTYWDMVPHITVTRCNHKS